MIQGCLLEAALGDRFGVSDDESALIGQMLPLERGRGCRPAGDNRPYSEGMMWMRGLVECLFSKLRNWRGVATRYDKTKESHPGFVALASIKQWILFVHVVLMIHA